MAGVLLVRLTLLSFPPFHPETALVGFLSPFLSATCVHSCLLTRFGVVQSWVDISQELVAVCFDIA